MNIYVGNLPYSTTDEDLKEMFSRFGEVDSARIIIDRYENRSKGFGFVEMSDDSAAQTAIKEMDGADMGGRTIKVNEARPREDRPRGGSRY